MKKNSQTVICPENTVSPVSRRNSVRKLDSFAYKADFAHLSPSFSPG